MAEDRTCLECIAQYSHLPVKLCEEHAQMTLEKLVAAAEAAQEKAWAANNAAWAAWQAAFDVAQDARALLNGWARLDEAPATWAETAREKPE